MIPRYIRPPSRTAREPRIEIEASDGAEIAAIVRQTGHVDDQHKAFYVGRYSADTVKKQKEVQQ